MNAILTERLRRLIGDLRCASMQQSPPCCEACRIRNELADELELILRKHDKVRDMVPELIALEARYGHSMYVQALHFSDRLEDVRAVSKW
jgi:hypothetical protein